MPRRVARSCLPALIALLLCPVAAHAAYGERSLRPELMHWPVFPIDGPHDLGRSESNRFGGGRGHGGQDLFADCGTPIVAAEGGRVRFEGFEGAAGHYLVVHGAQSGQDHAYMHLQRPTPLAVGDRPPTGAQVGRVGRSGRAYGCHLHFELWTAPGWYRGGRAIDPLPKLRAWHRAAETIGP